MLPFTREQFLAVFVAYNEAVWPAQLLAYFLGILMVVFILWPAEQRSRVIATGLAAMTRLRCAEGQRMRTTISSPSKYASTWAGHTTSL